MGTGSKRIFSWALAIIATVTMLSACSTKPSSTATKATYISTVKTDLKKTFKNLQDAYTTSFMDSKLDGYSDPQSYQIAAKASLKKITSLQKHLKSVKSEKPLVKDMLELSDLMLPDVTGLSKLTKTSTSDDISKAVINNVIIGKNIQAISKKYFKNEGLSNRTIRIYTQSQTPDSSESSSGEEPASTESYSSTSASSSSSSASQPSTSAADADTDTVKMINESLQPIIDGSNGQITSVKTIENTGKVSDWEMIIVYVPNSYMGSSKEAQLAFLNDYGARIYKTIVGIAFPDQITSDVSAITISFRFENGQEFGVNKTLSPGQFKVK